MHGYGASRGVHEPDEDEGHRRASVVYVILGSIVAGLGLFLTLIWVITFQWIYFIGIIFMAVGFLMFFSPLAGPDRSE